MTTQFLIESAEEHKLNGDLFDAEVKCLGQIDFFNRRFPKEELTKLTFQEYSAFCKAVQYDTINVGNSYNHGFNSFYLWNSEESGCFKVCHGRSGAWKVPTAEAEQVFHADVKPNLLDIVTFASHGEFNRIDEVKHLGHIVVQKIAYLYFPNLFVNIMSKEDIQFACKCFNTSYDPDYPILSNHRLLNHVKSMEQFADWESHQIGTFYFSTLRRNRVRTNARQFASILLAA